MNKEQLQKILLNGTMKHNHKMPMPDSISLVSVVDYDDSREYGVSIVRNNEDYNMFLTATDIEQLRANYKVSVKFDGGIMYSGNINEKYHSEIFEVIDDILTSELIQHRLIGSDYFLIERELQV